MYIRSSQDFERLVLPGADGPGEESLHLDFKGEPERGPGTHRNTAIDLAAFANSAGGVVVFGVREDPQRPKVAGSITPSLDVAATVEHVEIAITNWTYGFEERPRPEPLDLRGREQVVVVSVLPAPRLVSVRDLNGGGLIAYPLRHEHGNAYLKAEEVALRLDTRRGFAVRGQLRQWLRSPPVGGRLIYLIHLWTPRRGQPPDPTNWDEVQWGQVWLDKLEPDGARLRFAGPGNVERVFVVPYEWIISAWWNGDRPAIQVAATLSESGGLVKGFPARW